MKIKCNVQIISKRTIDEMPNAWTRQDYRDILEQLGFENKLKDSEVEKMFMIALANLEPEISAKLLLTHKLKEHLTNSEIQHLSHLMREDKASEEYPNILIHQDLFNINSLLFKSFKGHFPCRKVIELTMALKVNPISCMRDDDWINEIILKALFPAFGDHSAIKRLLKQGMYAKTRFSDASGILWKTEISKSMDGCFDIRVFSSEYWLNDLQPSAAYFTTIEVLQLRETYSLIP